MFAPICLFTYNRLEETKKTIEALKRNFLAAESDLYIFSDGPKNNNISTEIDEVRSFLKTIIGFKSIKIIESVENKGLANSVITGVTQIIEEHGRIIVLEDDLITTPNFLDFMNQALDYFAVDQNIQSINGFSLYLKRLGFEDETYFQQRPFSWGWATWEDRWDEKIFDKKLLLNEVKSDKLLLKKFKEAFGDDIVKMFMDSITDMNDSWYVRWTYNHFKRNTFSVYPKYSLVENIGFGESGTHCKGINSYKYEVNLNNKRLFDFNTFLIPSEALSKSFLKYFTFKYKLSVRLKLALTSSGRTQIYSEFKDKLRKL